MVYKIFAGEKTMPYLDKYILTQEILRKAIQNQMLQYRSTGYKRNTNA
jgi:hypothetical protein